MTTRIKYTALSRATNYEQESFAVVEYKQDISRTFTCEENINKKRKSQLEYDTKKGYTNNITAADIQTLFAKQNGGGYMPLQAFGECLKCGEFMKTGRYSKGDKVNIARVIKNRFHLIESTARKDIL
jgi:hypothetical protein